MTLSPSLNPLSNQRKEEEEWKFTKTPTQVDLKSS